MDMIIKTPNKNLTLDNFRGAAIELNKFIFHFKGAEQVNNHKTKYSHYKQNEFFENDDDLEDEQVLLKKHIEISLNNYHQNKLLKKHKHQFSHNLKIKRTKNNCFITLVSLNLNKTRFNNTSITYKIKYKRRAFKYLMWKLQKKLKIDLYKLTQKKGLLVEIDGTRVQLKKWRNFFTRKKLTYSEYVPAFKWHKKKRKMQNKKKINKQLRYKIKFFYKQKKVLKKKNKNNNKILKKTKK